MATYIKALRVYCDVVRAGSFSKAAEENGVSQSAASQVVQQLEEHLGVPLIDRSKRPWAPTREGSFFYRGCLDILQRYADLEARVRSFHDTVTGRVQVAAIYSVGLGDMSDFLRDFAQRHPQAEVQMRYDHPDRVEQLVLEDEVDLGLVSYPLATRQLVVEPWREEPIVLACYPGHPLSRRQLLNPADLDGLAMVGFGEHLRIRRQLDRALAQFGVSVQVVMTFDNTEVMKRAIEAGSGVGLLPQPTLQREVQLGTLVAIPIVDANGHVAMRRPLGMIHRKGKRLSATTQRWIRELQEREPAVDMQEAANAVSANRQATSSVNAPAESGRWDAASLGD